MSVLLQSQNDGFVDRMQNAIENAFVDSAGFLSDALVAVALVLVGMWIGGKAQVATERLGRRANVDAKVSQTPLEPLFGDGDGAAAAAFGVIVRYYVILIAAFAGLEYMGLTVLARWFQRAVTYVPVFVGGLVILLIGFYVADSIATAARESRTAQATGFAYVFGDVTKALVYFVALVIALDTMEIHVGILYTFGEAFAFAFGLALALALGIAFGWGGKDYVAENLDDWHEEAKTD